MTETEINIAVAECLGWTFCRDAKCEYKNVKHVHRLSGVYFVDNISTHQFPPFTKSLDACAEFEKTLTPEQEFDYIERLAGLIMCDAYEGKSYYHNSILPARELTYRATPLQRCEAYLRVKCKWKQ